MRDVRRRIYDATPTKSIFCQWTSALTGDGSQMSFQTFARASFAYCSLSVSARAHLSHRFFDTAVASQTMQAAPHNHQSRLPQQLYSALRLIPVSIASCLADESKAVVNTCISRNSSSNYTLPLLENGNALRTNCCSAATVRLDFCTPNICNRHCRLGRVCA